MAGFTLVGSWDVSSAAEADSADDVCAGGDDPCVISDVMKVARGAVLDFGLRGVELGDGGRFDIGEGGTILCGPFTAAQEETSIDMRPGGTVAIHARRTCSDGPPAYPCLDDAGCNLGLCSVRHCTRSLVRACSEDAECQVGTCQFFGSRGRCSLSSQTACATNADCDLGGCEAQLYCATAPEGARACTGNTDCAMGSCSVGSAPIELGAVVGSSDNPGRLLLSAADSVTLGGRINLSGRTLEQGDGGDLKVVSSFGSVAVYGRLRARGDILSTGGYFQVFAAEDVLLASRINVEGGDYDGGLVDVLAGRDIFAQESILASARAGAGFGGEILLEAGRNLTVAPGPDTRRIKFLARGNGGAYGGGDEGGDGGVVQLFAGPDANLTVDEGVEIGLEGGRPEGYGGEFAIDSLGSLRFDGTVKASSRGIRGAGGYVDIDAVQTATLGPASIVDVSGMDTVGDFGGKVSIRADGDISLEGSIVAESKRGGNGATFLVRSDGDIFLSGSMVTGGEPYGIIDVEACRISLLGSASMQNAGSSSYSRLTAHESMSLLAGSEIVTEGGANRLVYRTDAKPPLLDGNVSPAPQLTLNGSLSGCPVCGNQEVDEFESCDDGNLMDGDGCSSSCQTE